VGVGVPPASPSFNIIGDGQFNGVNGNVAQDPLLVAPQAGDFHLKPQSPAIDTGDNNSAQGTYDFEGDPRISDGNDDGTVVVDRGADEHSTNDPPVADAGEDGQVECAGPDGAFVVLDGSRSSDPDSTAGTNDDIVRFEWYEDYGTPSQRLLGAGETLQVGLSLGSHSVTLKVTDRVGKSDTAGTTVAVVDTTPPVMECPAVPGAMECTGLGGAWVDLFAYAYDTCGEVMTLINDRTEFGPDAADIYPVGSTAVGFTATDQNGVQATCSTTVNVVDTIPPELALLAEPATLWPPDRRLVSVAVRWVTRDACDPDAVSVELDSATSDEPDTGRLMGNDIQGAEIGTADGALGLRAERNGQGAGRVYTLTYRAIDGAGNVTLREATVSVPHDQQPSPSEILPRTPARRMRGGRASMPPPVPTVPH
jgi:hypothetical protein